MAIQIQIQTDDPRPGYCSCGQHLVQLARQTMSSPAEYGCPRCDGGLTDRELARLDRDMDDDGDARFDDHRENPEDDRG